MIRARLVGGARGGDQYDLDHDQPPPVLEIPTVAGWSPDFEDTEVSLLIYEHVPWQRAPGVPATFPGYEQYRIRP